MFDVCYDRGHVGTPFFDLSATCSSLLDASSAAGTANAELVSTAITAAISSGMSADLSTLVQLPTMGCTATPWALSLSVRSGTFHAFQSYGLLLLGVATGAVTGATNLYGGTTVPPFTLITKSGSGGVIAMGTADGWTWTPALIVTKFSFASPLYDTQVSSSMEVSLITASALYGRAARLKLDPPPRFQFQWKGLPAIRPLGAGVGPNCDANEGTECWAVQCQVQASKEDGTVIDLPQCVQSATSMGCCFGSGQPGQPVFVQLLTGSASTSLPPSTYLFVTFATVITSSLFLSGGLELTSWNITTAVRVSGAGGGHYVRVDEVTFQKVDELIKTHSD